MKYVFFLQFVTKKKKIISSALYGRALNTAWYIAWRDTQYVSHRFRSSVVERSAVILKVKYTERSHDRNVAEAFVCILFFI